MKNIRHWIDMCESRSMVHPDHDYNPEWDYEVVPPPEEAKHIIDSVEQKIRLEVLPKIGIGGMQIFFTNDLNGALARYVHGTSSHPFIGIDFPALVRGCEKYGLEIEQQLAATIVHELAHALQDANGIEEMGDEEEDAAEEFARHWVLYGRLDPDILSLS